MNFDGSTLELSLRKNERKELREELMHKYTKIDEDRLLKIRE